MAYKIAPFYNLDYAVGPKATNQRQDVLLVQFFLKVLYQHPPFKQRKSSPTSPLKSVGELVVDGRFGRQTETYIRDFQQAHVEKGLNVHPDGRVDPARGVRHYRDTSSITRTYYTISQLNGSFRRRFTQEHDHLENSPRLPGELRPIFKSTDMGS